MSSKVCEVQTVYELHTETGELECLDFGFDSDSGSGSFLSVVSSDPVVFWV